MPLTFPSSPSINDETTTGGRTYRWNGEAWELVGSGIPGPTGPLGAGVAIVGSVTGPGDLPTGYTGAVGDSYIAQTNGNMYAWDGEVWNDVGKIVGPTGPTGFGATGPSGSVGATGPTGAGAGGLPGVVAFLLS